MDLYTNEQGNILTKGDTISCKKQSFVITVEGYIDTTFLELWITYFKPQIPSLRHSKKMKKSKIREKKKLYGQDASITHR